MALVQVDKTAWVDPAQVEAVTPGTYPTLVRLHLRSGSVLAVSIGADRTCKDIAAVVALLFTPLNTQPPPYTGPVVPVDGWRPLGNPPYITNEGFPPGTILSSEPEPC